MNLGHLSLTLNLGSGHTVLSHPNDIPGLGDQWLSLPAQEGVPSYLPPAAGSDAYGTSMARVVCLLVSGVP